jgi:hypothetical protein
MRILPAACLALLTASGAAFAQGSGPVGSGPMGGVAAVCDPAWSGVPRLEAIAYCQGYLTAAGHVYAELGARTAAGKRLVCLPNPPPTIAESGLAFAAWARSNPDRGNESAMDGLLRWAQATYPCQPTRAAAPAPHSPRPAR